MRQRYVGLRKLLAQQFSQSLFVRRVRVRVQKTHGDAFDAGGFERGDRCLRRRFIERFEHFAGSVEPLVDFETQITRH